MFITKKHLSRRTVLRGAIGAAIGLPLLDAMVPAASAAPPAQLRFGAVYVPNGVRPEIWTPPSVGKLELPPLLERFVPLREHINLVTGIRAPDPFGHHVIGSLWLSGGSAKQTQGADVRAGQTIDQYIADAIGRDTPLRSLELGIEGINSSSNSCQFGWSCIYLNTLSWKTATAPLPNEVNPQSAFERMFGDIGSAEERAARLKSKASILDSVIEAASRLNSKLAPQDRSTVERVSGKHPRGRKPNPVVRAASGGGGRHSRCACRHTGYLRRARACDVRPHRARVESRHHSRHHVHERCRSEQHRLPADRCARVASHRLASRERSRHHDASTRRSTRTIFRCSATSWKSCAPLRTAMDRCSITRWSCTGRAWATATSTIRAGSRSCWRDRRRAG